MDSISVELRCNVYRLKTQEKNPPHTTTEGNGPHISRCSVPVCGYNRRGGEIPTDKLGSIDLPAGALITRPEVEKVLSKSQGRSGRQLDLFVLAVRDAYGAHGYLDCSIVQHPSFNEPAHIVNYSLEIVPGSQYRLGSVRFDGAPDAMAAKLKLAWKMASGDSFDESYLSNFPALAQKRDRSLSKWMQTVITTYDFKADPVTHEVNCVFHFAKAVQGSE